MNTRARVSKSRFCYIIMHNYISLVPRPGIRPKARPGNELEANTHDYITDMSILSHLRAYIERWIAHICLFSGLLGGRLSRRPSLP